MGRPTRHRLARVLAVGAALAVGLVSTAAPALAADDGQWWYQTYNVQAAHDAGWTGDGIRIAVIGSQINPDLPVFDGADLTVDPDPICAGGTVVTSDPGVSATHDSSVTALLVGNGAGPTGINGIAPDASVTFIGYGFEQDADGSTAPCTVTGEDGTGMFGAALQRAIDDGAQIVTTSTGVVGDDDGAALAEAIARGVVVVSAVVNSSLELNSAPAYYRGVVAVNAMDQSYALETDYINGGPNIVPNTTVVAAGVDLPIFTSTGGWDAAGTGTGSSLATPLVAGMLALTAQKYPQATGNQLIQSLIHNTGADDHDLEYSSSDGFGYGLASLSHLLRVDPTQYADENPLLDKGTNSDTPTDEQLAAATATASATPTPSERPAIGPAESSDDGAVGIVIAIGVAVALVVIAAAVIAIVLVTRRSRNRRSPQ